MSKESLHTQPIEDAPWAGCYEVTTGGYDTPQIVTHGHLTADGQQIEDGYIRVSQIWSQSLSTDLKHCLVIIALVRLARFRKNLNVAIDPVAHFGRPKPLNVPGSDPDRNDGDVLRSHHRLPNGISPRWWLTLAVSSFGGHVETFTNQEGCHLIRLGPALIEWLRTHNIPEDRKSPISGRGPTMAQLAGPGPWKTRPA